MLENIITSETRLRLLIKFFISQANKGHLNGLASEMGGSTNKIRKELNNLQEAGYLQKVKVDNKVEYKANIEHPLFEVLRKVVMKHLGLEDIVENVLERMGKIAFRIPAIKITIVSTNLRAAEYRPVSASPRMKNNMTVSIRK